MQEAEEPGRSSVVYLVESWWYDSYDLLAAYDSEEVAIAHAADPKVVKGYGKTVRVREVGVRSRLQFKVPHERSVK